MIPLASKDKAQAFVSFNDGMYSCPSKLYHSIYDTSTSASSSGRGLNEGSSSSGGGDVGRQARNNSKRSRKPNSNTNNNQGNVSINYGTSVVSTSIATTTMMTMINNSTACTQASAVSQGTARPLLSRHEDANAFQNCFGSNKQGVVKNQSKLSRHVFNLFTATDPNALINNI